MAAVLVEVFGLEDIEQAIRDFGAPFLARLLGPALGAAANVVRSHARRRGFEFTDRSGRLRRSIRTRRIRAIYGGRRYKAGRAAVYAGAAGARQAHLVEEGHGGPRPARPYPYLQRALMESSCLAIAGVFE